MTGAVQEGSNTGRLGTVADGQSWGMGSRRNESTNLDGLRLQFEAVEGADGFVCIVGIRVVHKPVTEALPCGQDQNDDLPRPTSVLPDPVLRG